MEKHLQVCLWRISSYTHPDKLTFRPLDPVSEIQGFTVRLGTVSVGAIGFMSIRNKYGRTLINPDFCSADTWP